MKNNHLINIDKLPELLKHDYTFIDLRDSKQFKTVHITKFINIPYHDFQNHLINLPKNKPIFLICYSGSRSYKLAIQLNQLGYQAYSFNGGFYAIEHPINNQYY
ncbi:rhodanese-like domain-containing protein [Thomasclavelia sp.]|uniref:rhodanese-like domain-containing protein n=1 Tax=Thomasclavelia sp. TaxID=3025757 RepID=UPI0025EB5CD8|nr:rhodanese-like domain-containing protein [Thomasclavelia sp.]